MSYYEADAFARWAGARLPTEAEWEIGRRARSARWQLPRRADTSIPAPAEHGTGLAQCFGDVWEWTRAPTRRIPACSPPAGALGEYNAKFMCNQLVLRGGSCATPRIHIRATYRNFFPPEARWQFTGIRLARRLMTPQAPRSPASTGRYPATRSIPSATCSAACGQPQKDMPCKYFYDDRGSALFDEICELDEYYLTRTELAILRRPRRGDGRRPSARTAS